MQQRQIKMDKYKISRIVICVILAFICNMSFSQEKRAFLVGISNYSQVQKDSWSVIHGANDVALLTPTLKKHGFRIATLCNESATALKIRESLTSIAETCHRGDTVFLQFSCHGQPFEDMDGDEVDGWDEALVPYDAEKVYTKGRYVGENHITDDELSVYLDAIRTKVGPSGFVFAVIDACHAGSSSRGDDNDSDEDFYIRGTREGFSASSKPYAPEIDKCGTIKIRKTDKMGHICILEACRSYQNNREIKEDGRYYGCLSFYVNKALQKQDISSDALLIKDVRQWMENDMRLSRQNIVVETSK